MFISFGIIQPILLILKIEYCLNRRYGSYANYSVAYKETQSNRISDFRDFVCSLFPKAILFNFYCSCLSSNMFCKERSLEVINISMNWNCPINSRKVFLGNKEHMK